jgi:hypothetical protein
MSTADVNALEAFHWTPQPDAEQFVRGLVYDFLGHNPCAASLAERFRHETGTRFIDWIDSIIVPHSDALLSELADAGFQKDRDRQGEFTHIWTNPHGMFPRIGMQDAPLTRVYLKVESVADFIAANPSRDQRVIEGDPLSAMRRSVISTHGQTELAVIERHGYRGYTVPQSDLAQAISIAQVEESFRSRRRDFDQDSAGFTEAERLINDGVARLGVDLACDLFFRAEREYWQRRNHAAIVQKNRQDRLGLGWANHDHHTYRASRHHFSTLIRLLEKLGFHCRERFYAGREAGWGAQVLEQPYAGLVVFADVDLSAEELCGDFAHERLLPQEELGTVGLWCALHGEAFLQAGMHHLECQFDFDSLKAQLENEEGVKMMKPFTNFSYLRQAFTEGEKWEVSEKRILRALKEGYITERQANQFRDDGAIGSHLENLERNAGFKGFNQTGVSEIIAATDPRKQHLQSLTGVAADG